MSETHPKGSVGRDSLPLRCWVSVVEDHVCQGQAMRMCLEWIGYQGLQPRAIAPRLSVGLADATTSMAHE